MPGRAILAAAVLFVSLAFLTASTHGPRSGRGVEHEAQLSAAEIETRFESPVVAEFDETPIAEFARRVARSVGVPIRLDWESIAKEGVTPETAITINLSQPVQA